jgi:hypothetical protein
MATLQGLERVSPGHNIQLVPYVTFANSRFLGSGPGLSNSNDVRGGVDGKIVLKDALTLDFTLNPDFSQVESDDPQVTVNKRYEVYFPEKRPFFLENAGFFRTPVNLFFSRRIVDPGAGARLTGKVGQWAIGLLATDDRAPGRSADSTDPLHDHLAGIEVARVAREFGSQSYVGAMVTDRRFGSSYNRVASLDTRLKFDRNWSMKGQLIRSFDRELDGARSSGWGYEGDLSYSDRHFVYLSSVSGFDPNFRAPLGFVQRVDMHQEEEYASYTWKPERGPIASYGGSVDAYLITDHTHRITDWAGDAQFSISFHGPTRLTAARNQAYEYYLGQGFHKAANSFSLYTSWLKWLEMYGSYFQGDAINYSPAYGMQPFLGRSENSSFGATIHFPRLRLEQYYLFSRLAEGKALGGLTVFNNHIAHSKINYQFTHALSLRAIFDYFGQLPNETLVRQTHSKQLMTDILLTYLLHPGTALYMGYTNRFQNLGIDPSNPMALVPFGPPTYQTDRLLFIKLSYLFRF